jgi:hypothetical protein
VLVKPRRSHLLRQQVQQFDRGQQQFGAAVGSRRL